MTTTNSTTPVEQWGIFELVLHGSTEGNPYRDVVLTAQFSYQHRRIAVDGFYDGDGVYRIRFMPDVAGTWQYRTQSTLNTLNGIEGTFPCIAATSDNHGPVQVSNTFHFSYADGTPYKPLGTTCYAWIHQGDELEEQTLATLRNAPFNKLRMCLFPKHYLFNENEPSHYPFPCLSRGSSAWDLDQAMHGEAPPGWSFDFSRFDPAFFQHLEQRIADLMAAGIEADLILFHPYDRWGFASMDIETDERYLRYIVARLAAYRNIWWSLANEYDLLKHKPIAVWDRFFHIVQQHDPYQHLRSIHNWMTFYDHGKPWVTHQSIQRSDLAQTRIWREQYYKPVVVDECCYEGNIAPSWGNLSAAELVHRFWEATVYGGYVGHGETFLHPQAILWWSKGGVLHGESTPRLAFLQRILADSPAPGLDPIDGVISPWLGFPCAGQAHLYYLAYFGRHQPSQVTVHLPAGEHYHAEIIDTWNMTVTPLAETIVSDALISLPQKAYQAVVLRRAYDTN